MQLQASEGTLAVLDDLDPLPETMDEAASALASHQEASQPDNQATLLQGESVGGAGPTNENPRRAAEAAPASLPGKMAITTNQAKPHDLLDGWWVLGDAGWEESGASRIWKACWCILASQIQSSNLHRLKADWCSRVERALLPVCLNESMSKRIESFVKYTIAMVIYVCISTLSISWHWVLLLYWL